MSAESSDLMTLPAVARKLGVTGAQTEYAVAISRVQPTCRIGIMRLYNPEAVAQIESTLRRTGAIGREVVNGK